MKKVLSLVLALAMVLALAAPAFAATSSEEDTTLEDIAKAASGASTVMEGKTEIPTLKVVIPKAGKVIVNPYKKSVSIPGGDPDSKIDDTVISPVYYVTNGSDIKVKVGISATGKAATGVTLATAAPADNETANAVFLQFSVAAVADKDATTWDDATKETKTVAKTAVKMTDITLDEGDATENYIGYQVTGEAATAPEKPWTDKMTAGVTVAFTIKPVANAGGSSNPPVVDPPVVTNPAVSVAVDSGDQKAGETVTLKATLTDIDASKNPSYAWTVDSDSEGILSLTDADSDTMSVTIGGGASAGDTATVKVTVTYEGESGSETVDGTVTITVVA